MGVGLRSHTGTVIPCVCIAATSVGKSHTLTQIAKGRHTSLDTIMRKTHTRPTSRQLATILRTLRPTYTVSERFGSVVVGSGTFGVSVRQGKITPQLVGYGANLALVVGAFLTAGLLALVWAYAGKNLTRDLAEEVCEICTKVGMKIGMGAYDS